MRDNGSTIGLARIAVFVAALVLVLQAALAVAAPPVQRDIFGNVICAEGSTGQSPAKGGHGSEHMPDCCMLSCGSAFQAPADLPDAIEWHAPAPAAETAGYSPPKVISVRDRRTPANPRAPPLAA